MISPTFPPVIINDAITSVYSVIAVWIPVTSVPTSLATVAIAVFITVVSRAMTNCPAASVSRTNPVPLTRRSPATAAPTLRCARGAAGSPGHACRRGSPGHQRVSGIAASSCASGDSSGSPIISTHKHTGEIELDCPTSRAVARGGPRRRPGPALGGVSVGLPDRARGLLVCPTSRNPYNPSRKPREGR
jgi:hypothetical protein